MNLLLYVDWLDLVKVYGIVIVYSLWRKFKDEEEQRNSQRPWLLRPAESYEIIVMQENLFFNK